MKCLMLLIVLISYPFFNNIINKAPIIGKEKSFLFEDKLKSEMLTIKLISNNKISFKISLINKATGNKIYLNGIANSNPNIEDPEIDADDSGEAYPVEEFFFKNKCGLSIRLEADNFLVAKIYESACMKNEYSSKYKVSFDCKKTMKYANIK